MTVISRDSRKGGVLDNSGQESPQAPLTNGLVLPASYSKIVGTAICQGQNDILADCLPTMAYNAGLNAWARKGKFPAPDNAEPARIFESLGGLPANIGLDPAQLFHYWRETPICGHRLRDITAIGLQDFARMRLSIIVNASVCFTARLTQAQMTQKIWEPVEGFPPAGRHAFCATWYEPAYFYDDTWGEEIPMSPAFIARQGINAWWCNLIEG